MFLFGALAWDLLAHPNAPQFSAPQSPVWYHALFGFVILPLWWVIRVLMLLRAPGNSVSRFLLLTMIGALGWQFTFGIGSPQLGSVAFVLFLLYWSAIGFPSLVYLLMVFPDGKLFPSHWRRWELVSALIKVLGTILDLISIQPGTATFVPQLAFNPFFIPALAPYQFFLSATLGVAGLFILVGVVMGIGSLVMRYRAPYTRVQQQIKWLLWWAVVFVLLMPLYYLLAFGVQLGNAQISALVALLFYLNLGGLFTGAIVIAILRYHLFDIDLLINRTLVYGALTAFVVLAYGLIVGYLSTVLHSDNLLFSLIATGIVAILFQPLREWLQRAVNHLLYGERDDPYAVLSRLGQGLESTRAPDAILPTIETVAKALKLPYVAIEMTNDERAISDACSRSAVSYQLLPHLSI